MVFPAPPLALMIAMVCMLRLSVLGALAVRTVHTAIVGARGPSLECGPKKKATPERRR